MITATIYGWLEQQGLWQSALGALLYWGVPLTVGFIGRKGLARLWRDIRQLAADHNAAEHRKADHLEAISAHLERITTQTKVDE